MDYLGFERKSVKEVQQDEEVKLNEKKDGIIIQLNIRRVKRKAKIPFATRIKSKTKKSRRLL